MEWIRWPYRKVLLAQWDAPFTLLPKPYAALPLDEVGALMHGHSEEWQLQSSTNDYQIAFHAEKGIQEWAQQSFDNSQLQHPWQSQLALWQQEAIDIGIPHVRIHVHATHLSLCVFSEHQVLLANTFKYHTEEDFLYFALLAYEQLDFDPEEHPLILSGEITRSGQLYPLLYRYIRDVRFAGWPSGWEIGDFVGHIPAHYYEDLLALLS